MKYALLLTVLTCTLSGCSDKYQEGFDAGYLQGEANAETRLKFEYEQRIMELQRAQAPELSVASTSSCGGAGSNSHQ